MSAHRRWACALVLAYGAPALAQEATPALAALRWADVTAALERDPRLAASRSRIRSAEGALTAARTPPNPEVEATAGRAEARDGALRRNEWGLALTIPLDWLARRGPEVDAARATVDEAAEEARELRAEVTAELWRLYVGAAYAQAEAETLEATERQADALARLVRRRVEAGEGRPVEIPRVELELERVRNQVDAARAARDGALAQLGAWLAVPVQRVEPPPPPPPLDPGSPMLDASRHPRVRAALARAEAARAEASLARRSRVPALSVGGFYTSELDREAVGGRVGVELPLWDWKSGRVRRAEAAAAAEASRADAEGRALAAAHADAVATCGKARAIADRQTTRILPRAEESARTLERTFELGETGILDVIDARRVLLEARREYLSSARERDVDCGALILLSGRELP
ncbi:TolC family protein [Anaeromyxobacter dehalogenans]|uniref:Outer membrane efflux protein n=1 Tax=Anaeromyxobacter dehalogenans (strain 2CP-C) TaxID=290397 RepID=Q2IPQ9_ANADE|nr:TolC family protein [Anaeromyxobacter dehalogenans]ABC80793.1 outer membrane efflux protein [Anaeromyxobacter dehalogenans 2CP-C]